MKTLTVFTPTFNRAYCLHLGYEALKRQTNQDFEWLIIDDGSSDQTTTIVKSWLNEPTAYDDAKPGLKAIIIDSFQGKCKTGFLIRYIKQKNQGMHGAHNTAYRNITTELNVCVDSDDYMPDDGVEKIVTFWKTHGSDNYAGIIGLDQAVGGDIIGTRFPAEMKETTLKGFYRQGGKGDKKLVYRTDVITRYPEYPLFEGEKYVGLAYKYSLIDQDYKLLVLDEVLCLVDYQTDGSSMNMYRQYWKNPKGFAFLRIHDMKCVSEGFAEKFKTCVHYVSSSIIARNNNFINQSPLKVMTVLVSPFGLLLYMWIRYNVKKNNLLNISK